MTATDVGFFANTASRFQVVDYVIFILILCVSICIGIYHACSGGKQKTASEYLMGNRNMGKLPIAMSLLASFMSSIAMLGMPSEIYMYGGHYYLCIMGLFIALPASAYLFLPVFYKLKVTSTNEYIERRFNRLLRLVCSALFIIAMVIYAAFVIYGPATALRQVSGLSLWASIAAIGIVGTFYTSIGGIKAVMWTDVVQLTLMFISMGVICVKGTIDVGGISELISRNNIGQRFEPLSFSFDPRLRYTFWACLFGPGIGWLSTYGVYQTQVQRYLSSPTMKDAQKTVWLNLPGLIALYSLCCYVGFILYTKYWNCDPMFGRRIEAPDQILPLFVMETMSSIPGLPGLFVAGVFSGSLSTVSSVLNSLAAVTLEDVIKALPRWKKIGEETGAKISKIVALSFGLMALLLASLGDSVGSIIQASAYVNSGFSGCLLGIFCLGLFIPWSNCIATEISVVVALIISFWVSGGNLSYGVRFDRPPVSIEGCVHNCFNSTCYNLTEPVLTASAKEGALEIYKLSWVWMTSLPCFIVLIMGSILSLFIRRTKVDEVDPRLLSPPVVYIMKRYMKIKFKKEIQLPTAEEKEMLESVLDTKEELIRANGCKEAEL